MSISDGNADRQLQLDRPIVMREERVDDRRRARLRGPAQHHARNLVHSNKVHNPRITFCFQGLEEGACSRRVTVARRDQARYTKLISFSLRLCVSKAAPASKTPNALSEFRKTPGANRRAHDKSTSDPSLVDRCSSASSRLSHVESTASQRFQEHA